MKKTLKLFAILAVLLFAASCQNNGLDGNQSLQPTLKVTATIVTPDATRVSYDVDNASTHTITPTWTVGDKIIGFDDDDHTFTFTVSSVDGAGRAVLDLGGYAQGSATKLYAIHAPGKTESNFSGTGEATTLAVDLSTQDGAALNDNSPVLMCATAEITAGSATLTFENQTAIIGVTRFKLPAAATVTSVSVDGLITTGTFSVDGGTLILTPGTTPATVSAAGSWATGADNVCETPLYFATLPTASAKIALRASDGANDYGNLASIAAADIVAGNYYYMQKILGAPVADVNGVKYGTIDDAFAAANRADSDVTVTLLADCSAAARLSVNTNVGGTGAVTFDLNGHNLSMTNQIRVTGRTLTITDASSVVPAEQGTITSTYATGRTLYIEGAGSVCTVNAGKIHATNYAAVYSAGELTVTGTANIESSTGTCLYNNNGTMTVEGNAVLTAGSDFAVNTNGSEAITYVRGNATMTSVSGNAVYAQGGASVEISGNPTGYAETGSTVYASAGTINISGGNFSRGGDGNGFVVYTGNADGRINISGGTFTNTPATAVVRANTAGSIITVTGGYFISNGVNPIDANGGTSYVSGGCFNKPLRPAYAVDASSNTYVNVLNTDPSTAEACPFTLSAVSATPKIATVTQSTYSWEFGLVDAAVKAADIRAKGNGISTVTLDGDCAAAATLTIGSGNSYAAKLDLNGHTLSSSSSPAVTTASTFVLQDSGAGGELTTTGAVALNVTDGITSVNSGSVYGATNAATVSGGTLNIYDAHIYGAGAADIVKTAGSISLSGGYYRYEPDGAWLADGYASAAATEVFNTRSYDYQVVASAVVATVAGENYGSWDAAVAAANSYGGADATVAMQLLEDVTTGVAITLSNASKPIALDLNGHTINVSVAAFLNCNNELTITDTGSPKGKIISDQVNVIQKIGTGTITLDGCVIASTATASSWYNEGVVRISNSSSTVIVQNGTKIYATGALSGLACRIGSATVTDSEISSGTVSAGAPAITTGGSTSHLTINSGSFYTSATSRAVLVNGGGLAAATEAGTTTINGGYFYASAGAVCLKGNYSSGDHYSKITVNGGYFNKTILWSSMYPTMGSGLSEQSCSVTNTHETTGGEYTYTYTVTTTP